MFNILVSDKLGQAGLDILESAKDAEVTVSTGLSEDELINVIGDYEALIIRSGTQVTPKVLEAAKKLRVVGRAGVGVDNVDIEAATLNGVIVMNTPSANTIATAELALTLMLSAARNVVQADASLRAGEWRRSDFAGTELRGKTVGIVGFGRIGREVASRCQAFDMKVHVYDPYVSEAVARELNVELMDLDEVLAASDYVTLHSVLNDETRQMINAETLATMKQGATLINVARGGLLDEAAVAASLDAGHLGLAAIDVFSSEPPEDSNPLKAHPRVIHTPHLGASTAEAQRDVAIDVATQVLDALRGDRVTNSVNLGFSPTMSFDAVSPFIELAEKIGMLQVAMADGKITSVEIEVNHESADELMKPVAAGLMKGLLDAGHEGRVNYINAPVIGSDKGIKINRSVERLETRSDTATCRVKWDGGERVVSGKVYDASTQRIVRISSYSFEADPKGTILLLLNQDVPGVIGTVATKLGELGINVGEWRLGRDEERAEALSFINLDTLPSVEAIDAIAELEPILKVAVVEL